MKAFVFRLLFSLVLVSSIYADGFDVTKLLPDTYCKKYPQTNNDLGQAYSDYTMALQYVQAVITAQSLMSPSLSNDLLVAKESMDDSYNNALTYDTTAPEYSLVVLKSVYDMLLDLSGILIEALKSEDINAFDISGTKAKVDSAYNAALTKIKGTTNKLVISQTIKTTSSTLNQLVCKKVSGVEAVIKYLKFTQDQQALYQQEVKALEDRYNYFIKYQAFLKSTAGLFGQLEKIYVDAQQIIDQLMKTKVYNQASVVAISKEYVNVLNGYLQAYQNNNIKIDASDASNRLVVVLNNMARFFGRLIAVQTSLYQSLKNSTASDLNNIVLRVIGSQGSGDPDVVKYGYDGFIQNTVNTYLSSGAQGLLTVYANQKMQAIYVLAIRALDALAHLPNVTALQLTYGEHLYAMLNTMMAYISGDNQITELLHINSSIAALYGVRGQTILTQEMSLDNQKNSVLLNAVISAFNNAVTHYTICEQKQLVNFYQQRADILKQARFDLQAAQNSLSSGNIDAAIDSLRKASQEFMAGGDTFDGTLVQNQLVQLAGQQQIDLGKKALAGFVQEYKTPLQAYVAYLNNPASTDTLTKYDDIFASLLVAAMQAQTAFSSAQDQYNAALANNPSMSQDKNFVQNSALLKGALQVLSSVINAQKLIDSADKALSFGSQQLFSQAQQQYMSALSYYQQADIALKGQAGLSAFISIDPAAMINDKTVSWNFYTLGLRHVARRVVESLTDISDVVLKLAYLNFVQTNFGTAISAAMQNYVSAQITQLSKDEQTIQKLLTQADTDHKAAAALVAADWQATAGGSYQSKADSLWKQVLQEYWSVYQLGKKDVLPILMQVINQYATVYQQNVDARYYPASGAAMIDFYAYVIDQALGDEPNSQKTLTSITATLAPFLDIPVGQLDILNKAMKGDAASAKIGMDTNKALAAWIAQADALIAQQQQIFDQVGGGLSESQKQQLQLLTKTVDAQGNITYTYEPKKQVIAIGNPLILSAQLGQKLGDYFYAQKDYDSAKYAYWLAITSNKQLGRPDDQKLDMIYNMSKARSDGWAFFNYVILGPLITVGQFAQVPSSYKVKVYQQPIPDEVLEVALNVVGITINDLSQLTQDQLAKLVINLAKFAFLYHKIADLFLTTSQFQYYLSIISNHQEDSLPPDQKLILLTVLTDWQNYSADLQKRIDNKESNLLLRGGQTFKNSCLGISSPYMLIESNAPMPSLAGAPNYSGFYQCYPSSTQYYSAAQTILASGDQAVIGSTIYRPAGNDADGYKAAQNGMVNVYISHGYGYKAQIDQLMASPDAVTLSKISKSDMNVKIDDYQKLYDQMNNLYTMMTGDYYTPFTNIASYASSPEDQAALTKKLNDLLGKTFKEWADTTIKFLVGNPLVGETNDIHGTYFHWLQAATQSYFTAITTYNYSSDLWNVMARLWEGVGDIVMGQNNPFGAVYYYAGAAFYFGKFAGDGKDTVDTLRIKWKEFSAYFNGSSDYIKQYNNYKKNPIEITLSTGEKQQFTYAQIFDAYNGFQNGEPTDDQIIIMAGVIRNKILDSLLYYAGTSSLLTQAIGGGSSDKKTMRSALMHFLVQHTPKKALLKTAGDNPADDDQKKAADLIDTFMKNNKLDLSTISGAQALIDRSDFPAIIENEFDQLHKQVTPDAHNKAVYYGAMSLLASRLYNAFSNIYTNDFYGTSAPDVAAQALSQDLQTEAQNIQHSAEQYIGQ